uniref:Uncharacterized protein n=1 Tax=Plectus sambesii TaxID=2011161 RepID=A0A914UXA5_9BILA
MRVPSAKLNGDEVKEEAALRTSAPPPPTPPATHTFERPTLRRAQSRLPTPDRARIIIDSKYHVGHIVIYA